MRTVTFLSRHTMLLLGAMVSTAVAAESTAPVTPVVAVKPSAVKHGYIQGWGQRVDSRALAMSSGGSEVTETITLNGTVSGNSTDHVVTGSNVIGSGAFNGATGVPMVIQNTGNSVLIQNATIINVQFKP